MLEECNFIEWLKNRLLYKHAYSSDDIAIQYLAILKTKLLSIEDYFSIEDKELDTILSKYYADFYLDKCDNLGIGYSEQERISLRNSIRNIVKDVINNKLKGKQ